ncbi:MAG: RNA-directed DNA polymerase [Gammaproteobacteria bacterium]
MNPSFITLADCLIAYRKAKSEAFYENPHMQALAFADYEKRLLLNLRDLLQAIHSHRRPWSEDREWLGRWYYVPKSIRLPDQTNGDGVFYRCLDPLEEWRRQIAESGDRATVSFRLMIRPSVNLQMLSALWILKVGHLLDGALSKDLSYGNRLRRQPLSDWGYSGTDPGGINVDTPGLFRLYPYAYRQWRENGLSAMESALADNKRIVAITMDITKFYHRVNPDFVLREPFLAAIGVELSADQIAFSKQLLSAIRTWYRTTPDYRKHPGTALPVGLSASKVLANVLLADFDRGFVDRVKPLYYGRYVDDFFIVLSPEEGVDSGGGLMDFMARANPGVLTRVNTGSASGLRLTLPYAEDSELLFGAEKQKFFNLSGAYGLDLVAHISEQIRKQSSEHRFLPIVPETGQEMASRALLAQPEASLEVDAIRKADVISVRRLGFALLLRDMESYGRDLPPQSWRKRRGEFYDLISRHVVTPQGLFEFVRYMRRVFGLMVACRDYDAASDLVQRLQEVTTTLRETTTAGTTDRAEFISCMEYCAVTLIEAAMKPRPSHGSNGPGNYLRCWCSLES